MKVLKTESATKENVYLQADMHALVSKEFIARVQPICNFELASRSIPSTNCEDITEDGLDGHVCCLLIGAGHPDTVYIDIVAVCCLMLAAGFCVLLKQIL